MNDRGQQHHHGVHKNLADGIGGLIVGAALTVLLVGFAKRRRAEKADRSQAVEQEAGTEA